MEEILHAKMNPIIPGFAPDPSITLIGDVYFLVNSTFHVFPGLPIYASRDLITWTQIGNAINRREQLSLALSDTRISVIEDGKMMYATGGLYAPTIRHHNGIVFVICTNVIHNKESPDDKLENFIVSTKDIWSDDWSDPVFFDFNGIDPSIVWDQDGKAYVHGSAAPGPMTTINLFEIDLLTGKKISEEKKIWDGTGGIYPEGPHIYIRDGFYYLMISEGGTWEEHMITVARSKSIWGPYEAYEKNPILTAFKTQEYVRCTGHCDLIEDKNGRWWGVCLGVRKKGDRFMMGRESFLTPAKWGVCEWPQLEQVKIDPTALGGELKLSKEVISPRKDADLLYIRDADLNNYKIIDGGKRICLYSSTTDLSQWEGTVTFVGKRQRSLSGTASAILDTSIVSTKHLRAGLAYYKDEHRFARVFYDFSTQQVVFEMINRGQQKSHEKKQSLPLPTELALRITISEDSISFGFLRDGSEKSFTELEQIDSADISDADFVGPVIGVYAVSEEQGAQVSFRDFHID